MVVKISGSSVGDENNIIKRKINLLTIQYYYNSKRKNKIGTKVFLLMKINKPIALQLKAID